MTRLTPLAPFDPVHAEEVARLADNRVFDELLSALVGEPVEPGDSSDDHPWPHLRRKRSARRLRWTAVVVGAAAACLVIWVVTGPTAPASSTPPFTTAWSAARPLHVSAGAPAPERRGTWRLVDDLLSGGWTQNIDGPPPGPATCPTAQECYKLAGIYASSATNAPLVSLSLYMSSNAGASWTVLPAPSGFDPTSSLSCGSATWCAAGGTYDGEAALLSTANGGHTFSVEPLPRGVGTLDWISCPAAGTCRGLASTQHRSDGVSPTVTIDPTFLATADGGTTFTVRQIIAGDSMSAIDCTSALDCTVAGVKNGPLQVPGSVPVVATTTNGGSSWQAGSFPTGFYLGTAPSLSCANAMDCWIGGEIPVSGNMPRCSSGSGTQTTPAMSATVAAVSAAESNLLAQALPASGTACATPEVADVAATTNGGRTWTPELLPADVPKPAIFGLSCPTASECWIVGQELVSQQVGKSSDSESSVLLGTTNGGATWSKVTFNVPATAPNPTGQSYLAIGAVTCPTASSCLATGAAAAGASVSPVYRFVASSGS